MSALLVCLLSAMPTGVSRAAEPEFDIEIPVMNAAEALNRLAEQTGSVMLFSYDLARARQAKAVRGRYTLPQGLELLLRDTGLSGGLSDKRVVIIAEDGNMPAGKGASVKKQGFLAGLIASVLGSAASNATADQETEGARRAQLSEVIVTATRRAERVQDIPMSIAALSHDDIAEQGVQSLLDLSRIVPGLVTIEIGPGQSRVFLRGVANGNNAASLVGVYYDEIPVTGQSLGQRDIQLVDLERVEVLRGPQGTLYGQGSAGGTVRYISRKPELGAWSAEFDLTGYATEDGDFSEKLTGVVNLPVVDDVFGLRISGTVAKIGGWNDQLAAGREDINDQSLRDVKVRALWQATDALSFDATAIVHRNEGDGISAMPDENYEVSYPNGDPEHRQFLDDDFDIYNLTINYDFGSVRLLSSTSYVESSSAWSGLAFQFAPPQEIIITDVWDIETFAQELRLSSEGEGRLNWVLGAFYTDDTLVRDAVLDIYVDQAFLVAAPLAGTTKSETYSIFGDMSYAVTDRLELGVGLRYFNDDRSESIPGVTLSGSFNSTDPRLYATYAISNNVNLYANIAKGFRSGGFLGDAEASTFDPEEVWSYEVGTKGSAGRFAWDLAAYFSDYKDYQAFVLVTDVFGGVENAGDAEIKGLDWLFSLDATDQLTLSLSGNIVDTELVSVRLGATSNVEGDRLDFIYDYSVTGTAEYRFDWGADTPGFARVDYQQIGPATFTERSVGIIEAPSDTVRFLNLRFGIERGKWAAELFGQNLLGEDGLQDPAWSLGWQSRPRPPTYGVTLRARF